MHHWTTDIQFLSELIVSRCVSNFFKHRQDVSPDGHENEKPQTLFEFFICEFWKSIFQLSDKEKNYHCLKNQFDLF
jgi:hypothetical protein